MRPPVPSPTRRAVLVGALAGLATPLLAGCTDRDDEPAAAPTTPRDVVAADAAAQRERVLLAAYDAALLTAPQLADRLLPLRGDHAAHLAALGQPETPPTPAPPTAGASPAPGPTPTAPPVRVPLLPQEPPALLAALAELERRTGTAHGSAAVLGGRGLAAVLASAAASEASHVVALS